METTVASFTRHRFTPEELDEILENEAGSCSACGFIGDYVEPDARNYQCENCEAHAVQGFEVRLIECL